jgi:hypothetical protein
VLGPPVRGPPNPVDAPPGREGAPLRGGPDVGRALMGREPVAPGARLGPPGDIGRRAPGGGGIGRPDELMGRPGGGGMGRPEELSGGRVEAPPSVSAPAPRWVGRMVVGPSGDAARVGVGLGAAARLRTTLGASALGASTLGAGGDGDEGAGAIATGARAVRAAGAGSDTTSGAGVETGASIGGALVAALDLVAFVVLVALAASSGWTSRRSPSASARRRIRSAWASSIEAEGLEAPMPSFWARPSNSLLVMPSSLESSCTRIFFCAKTFPYMMCSHFIRTQLRILSQLRPFAGLPYFS